MQEMTSTICNAATTPKKEATQLDTDDSHHGDPNYVPTKTLTDTRDNNTYTVSKLADGKCWMTQNLRIAGKTITPEDSNVTSNYTIPASSISGFNVYDVSNAYIDSYGGNYSWHAATAGAGMRSLSIEGQNVATSICPKGWRLPTSGNNGEFQYLYNNYNSSSAIRSSPLNFQFSGYVNDNSQYHAGSLGYVWSSTVYGNDLYAYSLRFSTTDVDTKYHFSNKHSGFAVRCIAEDRTIHNLKYMQEMTPRVCENTTTPLKTTTQLDLNGSHHDDPNYAPRVTLTDVRDNNTYAVTKLADGKCWMTQNLRIAGKTITPADSDVTSNYTIPVSSISGFNALYTSSAYVDLTRSGFYSWHSATAGTGIQSFSIKY